MKHLYYLLNELIKSYHIFSRIDAGKATELLGRINEHRLNIAVIAEQRQIFYEQITFAANASGYTNDQPFTRDDIASLVIRVVASLEQDVTVSLTQLGQREQLFTRQQVQWQQVFSDVQSNTPALGQQIPFDFPQEVFLDKDESLSFGLTNQNAGAGQIIVHGCNLKDDYSPNIDAIKKEIAKLDQDGAPRLPKMQIVPIQFKFSAAAVGNPAVSVTGGNAIFSTKSDQSVILTEVSTDAINNRISLLDTGRNQEICTNVEMLGIAGFFTNQYTTYYPLPYPHLLRKADRIKMAALNGSLITADTDRENTTFTLCFRGFTM